MSDPDSPETTAGGLVGQIVGKAKSAVGSLLGKDDLEREGNLQQAQAEAEVDARREEQAAELRRQSAAVTEQRADAAAERERLRVEIETEERQQRIAESAAQREGEIALSAPEKGPGGSLALHWSAAPEAERYAVVFVSPDLTEIARVEDLAEPSLDLSGASLPPGLDPGSDVLYRVVAMRGGDEIARSRTVAITLPGR